MTRKANETRYVPKIRSRHPSHSVLRGRLPKMPFTSVIRFGSTTEVMDADVQINTTSAIRNSSSKLLMKQRFSQAEVTTAKWYTMRDNFFFEEGNLKDGTLALHAIEYPIVAKSLFGSRGNGNSLIKSEDHLKSWVAGRDLSNYIFEKFHNYNREYRLHVTEDGCFYSCRKMLRDGTPEKDRWFRNDSNSIWIREENADFDRPVNWESIVTECVKALKSCGLDFGACDVKVQSSKDPETGKGRKNPNFIIIEINSAPSFGEVTTQKYLEMLPELLRKKAQKSK